MAGIYIQYNNGSLHKKANGTIGFRKKKEKENGAHNKVR
jgi:hypothetical protein